MMKHIVKAIAILLLSSMFFACSNSVGGDSSGNNNNNGNNPTANPDNPTNQIDSADDNPDVPTVVKKLGVQFDFSNAKAIAKLEAKKDGSRAVSNADALGDIVKILEDGSMENAITVGENCSLSDIVAIYKSPLETSQDIFIVFNGESIIGYDGENPIKIGELICLHSDGSIADILKNDDATDVWNAYMSLRTDSVTFDANGNLYFISHDTGDLIYQFNPKTNELTKMVAAVDNIWYSRMEIDDEGEWLFLSGSRDPAVFIRAIPIRNPNAFINIYYATNTHTGAPYWAYDDKNDIMYFLDDGTKCGMFTVTKKGGFKDKEYHNSSVGELFEEKLFNKFYGSKGSSYSWNESFSSNDNFAYEKTVDFFISKTKKYHDNKKNSDIFISKDMIDIRFDKFINNTGVLKALALLTYGKKNEEAFEALTNTIGLTVLYNLYENNYNDYYKYVGDGYEHNFLADILYLKDTDTLLAESNETVLQYFDYEFDINGNIIYEDETEKYIQKEVKGCELFNKTVDGLYYDNCLFRFLTCNNTVQKQNWTYSFSDEYYKNDGSLDSRALLNHLFQYCNLQGIKEFRLTAFENDENYGILYSNLKNEDAIEWLAEDIERLTLFSKFCGLGICKNSIWSSNVPENIVDYYSFMNMISKTCFIVGTNEKALTWNCEKQAPLSIGTGPIPYETNAGFYRTRLYATDVGVYYDYYNLEGSSSFYYVVQVTDSTGKFVELVNKLPLPTGKVVQTKKNNKKLIMQYSLTDLNNVELGAHHIYAVDMENGEVTNCFDNVPNRNSLEVVSFNVADDLLYYSAVRGTSVENGIVNIVTNEYNPLTVQRKMVAVYTF